MKLPPRRRMAQTQVLGPAHHVMVSTLVWVMLPASYVAALPLPRARATIYAFRVSEVIRCLQLALARFATE